MPRSGCSLSLTGRLLERLPRARTNSPGPIRSFLGSSAAREEHTRLSAQVKQMSSSIGAFRSSSPGSRKMSVIAEAPVAESAH